MTDPVSFLANGFLEASKVERRDDHERHEPTPLSVTRTKSTSEPKFRKEERESEREKDVDYETYVV